MNQRKMDTLIQRYEEGKILLFAGNGVSMNLGLQNWEHLIDLIADDLGFDPEEYKQLGDFLSLAEFYLLKQGTIGRLRSWMDRAFHNIPLKNLKESKIHEYIAKGNFSTIYTTNYDNWIENAHDFYDIPYNKVVNVADISAEMKQRREIIKFHGDFSDDQSIVLTESSYFRRLQFDNPLDIKLQSDILGKSVLFIGYSLSDLNIRLLFYRLTDLWNRQEAGTQRPESFFFTTSYNPVQEEILANWGITTISYTDMEPGKALELFLKELTGL